MAEHDTNDKRRAYYDHEPAYRKLKEAGMAGWQSSESPSTPNDPYGHLKRFITSEHCPSPGRALELGCGGGQGSLLLANKDWEVFSTDYSRTASGLALENARIESAPIHVFVSDATLPLPVASGQFKLVVENCVYHCIVEPRDRRQFLMNAYDALEKGGVYFGTDMTAEGFLDFNRLGIDPDTRIAFNRSRFWATRDELENELLEAGFELLHCEIAKAPPDEGAGDEAVIYARK